MNDTPEPCRTCGQIDLGQTTGYPCADCGLPVAPEE